MVDIQKLIDAMSAQGERDRGNYHLTLGGLIEATDKAINAGCDMVALDCGGCPGTPRSYRGYYSDLAFSSYGEGALEPFAATVRGCLGFTFVGYKGGDFTMHEKTPLWVSEYGMASGLAIVGTDIDGATLILKTKKTD